MLEPAHLSRRSVAALLPLAATATPAFAAKGQADSELLALGSELEAVHAARVAFDEAEPNAVYDPYWKQHWDLRERINRVQATTLAGVAVKAKVLVYEKDLENLDEASIATALAAAHYLVDRAALSLVLDCLRVARAAA